MTTKITIAVSRVDWHDQVHDHLKTQSISPSIPYKWFASLVLKRNRLCVKSIHETGNYKALKIYQLWLLKNLLML